jgi:hypothetical protein
MIHQHQRQTAARVAAKLSTWKKQFIAAKKRKERKKKQN